MMPRIYQSLLIPGPRVVTTEIANRFDYNAPFEEYNASLFNLQYVSPKSHQELLNTLMVFCERSEEDQANGFVKLLSNKGNLMLMCLLGDVLFLLKVFQKRLQADDITIVDIVSETKKLLAKLDKLHQRQRIGGWEEKFSQSYNEEDGTFFGTVLWQKERRTRQRNLFVSKTRALSAVKVEVLLSLRNFMEGRLDIDDLAKESFSSFVKFSASEENIREVHASVAPDLDLLSLAQQYEDVQESNLNKSNPKVVLQTLARTMT